VRRVVATGLAIAIVDTILFTAFWWPQGVGPDRIFRGIAVGLFGRDALTGGAEMITAGIVLHIVNATLFVAIYAAVARAIPALRKNPLVWGPPYGLAVYFGMNFVVIPLSRIGYRGLGDSVAWIVASVLFQAIVVGIGAAWCASDRVGLKVR
jgi:hypothetical protein